MLKTYFVCLSLLIVAALFVLLGSILRSGTVLFGVVQCTPDYHFNTRTNGWLKLHNIPATWEDAFFRCQYEGAVLASPLNKELADALYLMPESRPIYLGTHDFYSKGYFVSIEGVPLSQLEIRWGPSEPGTGNCLTMSKSSSPYYMYTSSCNDRRPFICYKKFDNQTMNECGTFDDEYQLKQSTNRCYKVHHEAQSWTSAYGICASEGGHLVILNNELEASIVKDMLNITEKYIQWKRYHVGLAAWGGARVWTSIHGEKMEDVFNDWHDNRPDNQGGNQNHGSLHEDKFDDIDPEFKAMFVCEKSPEAIMFEPVPLSQFGSEE